MKLKYIVGAAIIVFIVYMGSVFVYGFLVKQQKENSVPTSATQNTPTNSSVDSGNTGTNTTPASKTFSKSEVATHNKQANCWLIINSSVYDITNFLDQHPGGIDVILPYCGKDATQAFNTQGGRGRGHSRSAVALLQDYLIGTFQ
jgi:cytochrome b involved in lipid metabolism